MSDAIEAVLAGIPLESQGAGKLSATVEDALESIDQEVSKRGTLHAESLDINKLKEASLAVLREAAHIGAYRGLAVALVREDAETAFQPILTLSEHLFGPAWPGLHPQGKRAGRLRSAWAKEILALLAEAGTTTHKLGRKIDPDLWRRMLALKQTVSEAGIDIDALAALEEVAKKEPAVTGTPNKEVGRTDAVPASSIGSAASVTLDARGRVRLREDTRLMAQRITEFLPNEPVAYHMRGFVAWMELPDAPDHEKGVLSRPGLEASLRDSFIRLLEAPSLPGIMKLEDRLLRGPDWFEGQLTLFRLLEALKLQQAARAVRDRCVARLTALPALIDLRYPNGDPMVPDPVRQWVRSSAAPAAERSEEQSGNADEDGVSALEAFNTALDEASSARDAGLARLAFARRSATDGNAAIARVMADDVLEASKDMTAGEWDSVFFASLSAFRDSL